MFVEKTYRPKFARQNFSKAEKFAQQNSYFLALGGCHTPHTPPEVTPLPPPYPLLNLRANGKLFVWGEGTNSARLFTPGKEKESIAKSEVHQISRALGSRVAVSGWSSLISKIRRTILHYNISYFCKMIWQLSQPTKGGHF